MIDRFVILAPILLLAMVGLLQFIGCSFQPGMAIAPDDPTFAPPAGTYHEPTSVTLADDTTDTNIYYTLDGSDPATTVGGSTQQYSSPLTVASPTNVSAIAAYVTDTENASAVTQAAYNILPPIAFKQFKDQFVAAGGSTDTIATPGFDGAVSQGSLIVVWIWYNTGGQTVQVASVIDSNMNMNYARAAGPASGAGLPNFQQEIWYGIVPIGGSNFTVTAHFSESFTGDMGITGHEFINADQSGPLPQPGVNNNGNSANAACGPLPVTQGGLVFAAAIFPTNGGPGPGFTQMSGLTGNVSEYQIPTAGGSAMATFTNTGQGWIAQVVTFN